LGVFLILLGIRENRIIRQKYDTFAKNASIESVGNKKEGAFTRHLLLPFEWLSVKSQDWCGHKSYSNWRSLSQN